jgi:hypothetical protein
MHMHYQVDVCVPYGRHPATPSSCPPSADPPPAANTDCLLDMRSGGDEPAQDDEQGVGGGSLMSPARRAMVQKKQVKQQAAAQLPASAVGRNRAGREGQVPDAGTPQVSRGFCSCCLCKCVVWANLRSWLSTPAG